MFHFEVRTTHMIFHTRNTSAYGSFTCEIFACEIFTYEILWTFTSDLFSHGQFHMWNFTFAKSHGNSHVKFQLGNFTCYLSNLVKFHMWLFTCDFSHAGMNGEYVISLLKLHSVKFTHGQFHMRKNLHVKRMDFELNIILMHHLQTYLMCFTFEVRTTHMIFHTRNTSAYGSFTCESFLKHLKSYVWESLKSQIFPNIFIIVIEPCCNTYNS